MPELPEVETIVRTLRRTIAGKRITGVSLSGKALRRPVPVQMAALLRGRTVREIQRRGKYIVLELEPRACGLIHLGMSGRLFYSAGEDARPIHTHAAIRFEDGGELRYCDPRRFGLIEVYEGTVLSEIPEIRRLGRDPLEDGFDGKWLGKELLSSRREIKSFLLDQSKIAGVGNIYACEALFRAHLYPGRRCHTIDRREAGLLARSVRAVLSAAIHHRGTSFSDFVDSNGELGEHQDFLLVFQREGEKCRRCSSSVLRMRQGNRSTYYCPRCQPDVAGL